METLRDLLTQHDYDDLVQFKADLQERIEEWLGAYDLDSPDALREHAAGTETAMETRDVLETANDWELVQYRLDIVEDAIENYTTYTGDR